MSKVNWSRAITSAVIFALIGLGPTWYRWGFLGLILMFIAIKIEELKK